ncbi:hypothetical protein [Lentzea sp. CA-135723]|uniref:hypothetical protein n=1 Tax=Lentzea sp. CA-135723 TaxID=3239950 RepID=UPI003D93E99B
MKSTIGKVSDSTIEVAVEIDVSTGVLTRLAVFVGGQRTEASGVHEVRYHNGRDTWPDLRQAAWDATRTGSAGFVSLLDRWYGHAEAYAVGGRATGAAAQVQPGIACAADLAPSAWFTRSEPGTTTRKAAQAAVAARVFRTCNRRSCGPTAALSALNAYRAAIHHPRRGGVDVLLHSLLTDLRHLAEAYGIRLDSGWTPEDGTLAFDLTELHGKLRDAARTRWAPQLAQAGRSAGEVESRAFTTFLADLCRAR